MIRRSPHPRAGTSTPPPRFRPRTPHQPAHHPSALVVPAAARRAGCSSSPATAPSCPNAASGRTTIGPRVSGYGSGNLRNRRLCSRRLVKPWLRGRVRWLRSNPCLSAPKLYSVNMARARHPKKDVETALAQAEAAGWCVTPTSSGHRWGVMRCRKGDRSGCQVSIWSTPRNTVAHAEQLRRRVGNCPHGREASEARKEDS